MMNLILAIGRIMKWMMTLNLCLMPLNKILEINYTYGSLTQPIMKKILWRVNMFLFLREWMREWVYSEQNKDDQREKISCKGN